MILFGCMGATTGLGMVGVSNVLLSVVFPETKEGLNEEEDSWDLSISDALACRLASGVVSFSGLGTDIRASLITGLSGVMVEGEVVERDADGSFGWAVCGDLGRTEVGGYEGGPRGAILV